MSIENKIKIFLLFLVVSASVFCLFSFFSADKFFYVFFFLTIFLFTIFVITEFYLRIQHNVDRKNLEIKKSIVILSNRLSADSEEIKERVLREVTGQVDNCKKTNEKIINFLEKLLIALETNHNELEKSIQGRFSSQEKAISNVINSLGENTKDCLRSVEESNKEAYRENKDFMNNLIDIFSKNFSANKAEIEGLKELIYGSLDNSRVTQRKLSAVIEELIYKLK